jgi:hypothetical protein
VVLIQTKLSVGFDEAWRSDVSTSVEDSVCSEVQEPTLSTNRFIRASGRTSRRAFPGALCILAAAANFLSLVIEQPMTRYRVIWQ